MGRSRDTHKGKAPAKSNSIHNMSPVTVHDPRTFTPPATRSSGMSGGYRASRARASLFITHMPGPSTLPIGIDSNHQGNSMNIVSLCTVAILFHVFYYMSRSSLQHIWGFQILPILRPLYILFSYSSLTKDFRFLYKDSSAHDYVN